MTAARDTPGVIAPPPVIAIATLVLGVAIDWLMPTFVLRVLFGFWTRVTIGVLLIALGGLIALAGERTFRRAGTNVPPWRPALTLVTHGIYRWLRNPMYVGLAFIVAGFGIAMGADWVLVLLVPAALVMHYGVVLREERYLEAKFGDAYRAYRRRVPRYGWPG
jgi:protein-S-isoprenylcysteine O-methyltransferase Ste14